MKDALQQFVTEAQADGGGVLVCTLPVPTVDVLFCPFCGNGIALPRITLHGGAISMSVTCPNRRCPYHDQSHLFPVMIARVETRLVVAMALPTDLLDLRASARCTCCGVPVAQHQAGQTLVHEAVSTRTKRIPRHLAMLRESGAVAGVGERCDVARSSVSV